MPAQKNSGKPLPKPEAKPVRSDERVVVGITGFDDLVMGGLLPGNLTLVTGTTGTGKTIFGTHFLYNGALQGQNGVYVSFEEPPENIKANVKKFGMDFEPLERAGKIAFTRYDPYHVEDIYELIETTVKKVGAKRVVIDSVAALGLYVRDPAELRRMIFNIALLLRKLGCTAIITTEMMPGQRSLSRFGVEEFVSDAIVVLYYTRADSQFARAITVWKMRGSDHTNKVHPYRITNEGIIVYPKEEAFVKFD